MGDVKKRVPTKPATRRKKKLRGSAIRRRLPPTKRTIVIPTKSADGEGMAIRKAFYLNKYEESKCNVSLACKNSLISRSTVYNWRENDAQFLKDMEDKFEIRVDFYEDALNKNAEAGNLTAQIFFLKCRAKNRGYVERTEISGPGGAPIGIAVARSEVSDQALSSSLRRMIEDDPEFARKLLEAGKEDDSKE